MGEVGGVVLEREIGRGASSVVYLGTQSRFDRKVAVKVLDLPGQSELVAKLFRNECRTLGRLTPHPNIVTVFDGGLDDGGRPYLVMEYLPSGTLAGQLADEGPLGVARVLEVGVQLAGALHTTHLHDVVHGDVKPQNILRTRSGEVALGDFGIARLTAPASATTRTPLFTPLHGAPELFEGAAPTAATDVYELCSTLFELLDGRAALGDTEESPLLIVGRMARGERRSLDRSLAPDAVADVIESGMSVDPADRPASAQVLGTLLQQAQAGAGHPVTPMVVIDQLPDEPPGDGAVGADGGSAGSGSAGGGSGSGGSGGAGVAAPMDGPAARTLPPPGSHRRGRVALVGSLVAAAVLVAGLAWWARSGTDDGSAEEVVKAASTVPEEPTVTGTPYGGVQPDVTYDVPGHRDTSAVLAAQLGDLGPALESLAPGLTLIDSPTYTLERLPAIARWQAFNPERTPECMGILTDPLTVTGTWEKAASWPGNQLFLRVMQFADEDTAAEAYATLSLEQGVKAGECTGFAEPFGADDHDAIDVVHRIPPLSLPPGTRYNSWLAPPPPAMPMFTSVLASAVQVDDAVVIAAWATEGPAPSTEAMSSLLGEMVSRLSG